MPEGGPLTVGFLNMDKCDGINYNYSKIFEIQLIAQAVINLTVKTSDLSDPFDIKCVIFDRNLVSLQCPTSKFELRPLVCFSTLS